MANMASHTLNLSLTAIWLCMLACLPVAAQVPSNSALSASDPAKVKKGERLSDWLLRQTPNALSYPLGTLWTVPKERSAQTRLKYSLLEELAILKTGPIAISEQLQAAVEAMPVTARVRLEATDARWLQSHPGSDPILDADHKVTLPLRPTTVSVIYQNGTRCTLAHQSGAQIRDYLRACDPQTLNLLDLAWVVQADGGIHEYAVARWNERAQTELAPGALIWSPHRDSGLLSNTSSLMTEFLATQTYDSVLQHFRPAKLATTPQAVPSLPARDPLLSANNWGFIGLLETPSARMGEAGDARFHYSRIYPYERSNVVLQPFEWLEAGFRYTNVLNRLYGSAELSGDQTYKDKSIDLKLKLLPETSVIPQLAVGLIDAGGTGLFSSEYLVANKRVGDYDWSLGMAWGYLGSSGNIKNPLTLFNQNFNTRGAGVATGGKANTAAYFRGRSALFGGLQYHTPWDHWVLKAELDGNNYQNEPQGNNRTQHIPLNLGLTYRPNPSTHLSLGLERGNAVVFGLTLQTSVHRLTIPKVSDLPTPRITSAPPMRSLKDRIEWVGTAADVRDMSGWGVSNIQYMGSTLRIVLEGASGAHWNDRLERIIAVLNRDAPSNIDTFELNIVEQGIGLTERVVDRREWVKQQTQYVPPSERQQPILAQAPIDPEGYATKVLWQKTPSTFSYGLVPSWQQNIGGPDGFLLFSAGVAFPMQLRLAENLSISGSLSLHLLDNYDNFKYTGPSNLPRVRTYLREYMTNSQVNIPNLQITHFDQLTTNHFYSIYAGYLESSYGGMGAEWLYRPWHSPFAFGLDINRVQQRNFDQLLGFDRVAEQTGYRVNTGHASAYWETGWKSTQMQLHIGQYLAGDFGATVDVNKKFANGVSVGAWITRTNVSAEKFGEGSFDKGLYLRIPFDVMTTTRTGNAANLVYQPLTRDGGARLNRSFTLFSATTPRSQEETSYVPAKAAVGGSGR